MSVSNQERASYQAPGFHDIDVGPGFVKDMCTPNSKCCLSVCEVKNCRQFKYEPEKDCSF